MGLTVANVTHPNQSISEWTLGPFKARVVDLTFDSAYLTGGEVLTAATLGWSNVFGAVAITMPCNSTGTVGAPVAVKPNTAQTQLTFQLYEGAATANDNPLKECGVQDMSAYTGRFLVLGS